MAGRVTEFLQGVSQFKELFLSLKRRRENAFDQPRCFFTHLPLDNNVAHLNIAVQWVLSFCVRSTYFSALALQREKFKHFRVQCSENIYETISGVILR